MKEEDFISLPEFINLSSKELVNPDDVLESKLQIVMKYYLSVSWYQSNNYLYFSSPQTFQYNLITDTISEEFPNMGEIYNLIKNKDKIFQDIFDEWRNNMKNKKSLNEKYSKILKETLTDIKYVFGYLNAGGRRIWKTVYFNKRNMVFEFEETSAIVTVNFKKLFSSIIVGEIYIEKSYAKNFPFYNQKVISRNNNLKELLK